MNRAECLAGINDRNLTARPTTPVRLAALAEVITIFGRCRRLTLDARLGIRVIVGKRAQMAFAFAAIQLLAVKLVIRIEPEFALAVFRLLWKLSLLRTAHDKLLKLS